MKHAVFISYARRTSRAHAEALHKALGEADVSAFLDTSDIEPAEQIPGVLADAIFEARVFVVFAHPTYFTRWYCLRELQIAFAPFLALLRAEASEDQRASALAPIVVALHPEQSSQEVVDLLPPRLRTPDWPGADATSALTRIISERLRRTSQTIGERLERSGSAVAVRATLIEQAAIPSPRRLTGIPTHRPPGLPPSLGDGFVGRADELWRIQTVLFTMQGDGSSGAGLTGALEGGGGFGKTRLALEYFYRFGPTYYPGGLFWLDGDVPSDRLEEQHHGILKALRPEVPDLGTFRLAGRRVAEELRDALQGSQRTLFVVDNIPEPQPSTPPRPLSEWCPAIGEVALLLTSRARQSLVGGVRQLPVEVLSREAAVTLLTYELETTQAQLPDSSWRLIAEWVGQLPLALELMNGALRAGGISPSALLEAANTERPVNELDRQMEALRGVVPPGALRGITEALEVSYERLAPEAQLLARLIAQLSHEPVPFAVLDALGQHRAPFKARNLLHARSLVTAVPAGGPAPLFGRMHRILADFLRSRAPDEENELQQVCEALAGLIDVTPDSWPLMNACRPHMEKVFQRSEASQSVPTRKAAYRLGVDLTDLLAYQGFYTSAVAVSGPLLGLAEALFGPEDPAALSLMASHGGLLAVQGEFARARPFLERVVDVGARVLGEEDSIRLLAVSNLGGLLRDLGELQRARELNERVLTIRRRTLGDADPDTLSSMSNLGGVLRDLGDFVKARRLHERVLETRRRVLGEDALDTMRATGNLGSTLIAQGEFAKARALLEPKLETSCRLYGENHPNTLGLEVILADTLRGSTDLDAARSLYKKTLEVLWRTRGVEDEITLRCEYGLGETLRLQARLELARGFHERVFRTRHRILGGRHPLTSLSAWSFFKTLCALDDLATAANVLERDLVWLRTEEGSLSWNQQNMRQWLHQTDLRDPCADLPPES